MNEWAKIYYYLKVYNYFDLFPAPRKRVFKYPKLDKFADDLILEYEMIFEHNIK